MSQNFITCALYVFRWPSGWGSDRAGMYCVSTMPFERHSDGLFCSENMWAVVDDFGNLVRVA